MTKQRTAGDIIDQAIRENRVGEILTYGFATVFVLLGAGAIVAGIVQHDGIVSLAGAVSSALFIPALRVARTTRRENITMRLLEAPLSRAETAEQAAQMLQAAFSHVFVSRPPSTQLPTLAPDA